MKWRSEEPARDPERLWPTDKIIACPDCSSTLPTASIILLRNAVERDGERLVVISGERLSCQHCGSIYSVGPNGTFRHHPNALPQTPGPEREGPPRRMPPPANAPPEDDGLDPLPRGLAEPRERPRVP
jgi:hypothetical protein